VSDFLSFNPLTGVRKLFDMDEDRIYTRTEQDVEPLLDRTAQERHERRWDDRRLEFRLYARIPIVVQLELRAKGLDIYSQDRAMIRRVLSEINAHYPYLKATNKIHE